MYIGKTQAVAIKGH